MSFNHIIEDKVLLSLLIDKRLDQIKYKKTLIEDLIRKQVFNKNNKNDLKVSQTLNEKKRIADKQIKQFIIDLYFMTQIFTEEAVVLIEDLVDSGLGSNEHFQHIISDSSLRTEDFNDSDSDNSLDLIEVSDNESQCFTRIKPKQKSRKTFGNFNRVLIEIYFNFLIHF
jgi:hypothetical protein